MVVSKPTKMVVMAVDQDPDFKQQPPSMITPKCVQEFDLQIDLKQDNEHGSIIEEIEGVIKLHKNGYVERSHELMSSVSPSLAPELKVNARDVFIEKDTNIWARVFVPKFTNKDTNKMPIIIYFHGGGFCVGSTAWNCYHNFLGKLSSEARCVVVSVNYRLAPENRLPAAYEDGKKTILWVKHQAIVGQQREFWAKYCDFSTVFLMGDSAGANLAYNVALEIGTYDIMPLCVKGIMLIQPFFGAEDRTNSELNGVQPRKSVLSLTASDTYWRLALPLGADRDHPWCNPLGEGARTLQSMRVMVCVAEKDILRDRNLEFCSFLARNLGSIKVEHINSEGVGHAFHVFDDSSISRGRKIEMLSRIVKFVSK